MATKSTKRTKKVVAEPEVIIEDENVEEVEVVEEVIKVKAAPARAKRKFNDDDLIPCLSVFPGSVGMTGKRSERTYLWEDMGVVEYVEYQDLRSEVLNKKSSYIYKPLIIVDDEEFLSENPNLKQMYDDIYTPDEIMSKIKKSGSEELKRFINSLPSGIKAHVKSIAATMIQDGELDSVRKIQVLDNIFDTNLSMYSQFFADEE